MRYRNILSLVALLMMSCGIYAQQATIEEMTSVAQHQWETIRGSGRLKEHHLPEQLSHLKLFTPLCGDGFVIVTDQKAAYPVVAYSLESEWNDSIVPQLYGWLMKHQSVLEYIASKEIATTPEIEKAWTKWTTGGTTIISNIVPPLLRSAWSQSPRYNNYCPVDNASSSGHAVVGCVATAMAQVMKYWQYPAHGTGTNTYYHEQYGLLEADFENTTYQWDQMPYQLDSASLYSQIDACALLCYHCGVSVNMHYGAYASGSYVVNYGSDIPSAESALKQYFGYNPSLQGTYRQLCTDEEWVQIIKEELSEGRPVIYSGVDVAAQGGHAFICDGYDNNNYFHFDWGWNGYENGYYLLQSLNPAGYYFNDQEACLIGVEPSGRLRMSEKRYTCSADAGDVVVSVYSSTNDSTQWHLLELPSWITASQEVGDGNGVVTDVYFHVAPNTEGETREALFCVAQNNDTVWASIAQFACSGDAMCDLNVYMYDVYGDGYQFNKLMFSQADGTEYATVTLANGFDTSVTVRVCNQELVLNWIEGFYSSEDGFVITNGSGDTLAYHEAGEDFVSQEICRVDAPCSNTSCPTPIVESIEEIYCGQHIELSSESEVEEYLVILKGSPNWSTTPGRGNWVDTLHVGESFDMSPVDMSPDYEKVTDFGFYEMTVRGYCGNGNYSWITNPVTFEIVNSASIPTIERFVSIYPNPAYDMVTVEVDDFKSVEMFDMMGKKVFVSSLSCVDVSDMQRGIYLLKISTDSGVIFRKILLK